jgi:hypothetical protein
MPIYRKVAVQIWALAMVFFLLVNTFAIPYIQSEWQKLRAAYF